ncbi:MAG: transglycosylase SLT domain-containing protein [Thermodesulfovibrionales bacterium]
MFILILLIITLFPATLVASSVDEQDYQYLSLGKINLDNKQFDKAIENLTKSIEKLPLLTDYALYWRAIAYQNIKDTENALNDIKIIMDKYKESPLYKLARQRQIDILRGATNATYETAVESYIKDFPDDYQIKYSHALYLKDKGEHQRANRLFIDVFTYGHESLANRALKEIDYNQLSAEQLLRKANNLNKVWLFSEAERYFRDAQKRDKKGTFKSAIKEGLAYSLFRQKRYSESAVLYNQIGDTYWYARSLLRAREIGEFEKSLSRFKNSTDKRMLSVLISYSNIKRRGADIETSLNILNDLLKRHKSREDQESILWAIGWTRYITRDYEEAIKTFSQLWENYRDNKYLYWLNRAKEQSGKVLPPVDKIQIGHRDYYGYLTAIKHNQKINKIEQNNPNLTTPPPLQRADILFKIGLKTESIREAVHSVRHSGNTIKTISASSFLNRIGNYRYSVNIISKAPYSEEYHSLLYPHVFADEISEASRHTGIDPLLIMAIIREESRYDTEARSIAGAIGLMQLMPSTAKNFQRISHVSFSDNRQLYNPRINIAIGTAYLKHLIKQFGSLPPSIAAYNAGEEPVNQWIKSGNYKGIDEFIEDIPYSETNNYVKKVLTSYFEYIRGSKHHSIDKNALGIE